MSYSIDISLQIWHPSLSGNQLQALFNKIPNIKHSVGERIIRKDGEKLFTKYVDSYICYDIIPLQDYTDFYEPLKKEDYVEPRCLLCGDPLGEETKASPIPQQRIIEKMDEYMSRRDYAGAERHLLYWLEEVQENIFV